jgi:phage anti-repressor protein
MSDKLIPINYDNDRQTVLGRDLHNFLEVESNYTTWFIRMTGYGFLQGMDFIPFSEESTGGRPSDNHQLSIDMAKEIAMLQRTEKGKQARQYFIELEKKWNSPEAVMARALKMADKKLLSLQSSVNILTAENKLLSRETLTWADRKVLEALVKAYGASIKLPEINGFQEAWRDFKKELLYAYGINLNSRITNYLNDTGKKTKPSTLSMIHDDELPKCISTAVALCKSHGVDISDIIKKYQKSA